MDGSKLHVAILVSPGMGHLIPVLVLANRLATHHRVKVTVLVVTTVFSPPECQLLKLPDEQNPVDIIELPPVDISHLVKPDTKVGTQLCMMVREALRGFRSAISAMYHRPDALIVDLFCTEALPIAAEFNMAKYVYVPTTAWFTALTLYCPVLDKEIDGQYVDQEDLLKIPGCKPVRPEDVVDPMLDRNDQHYYEYVSMGNRIPQYDGILLNTWEDLDSITLKAFKENEIWRSMVKIPVYPIGPLRRPAQPDGSKSAVIEWLDKQPNESVIFVSFGSGGMLSAQQITELAIGLELSEQRFIWVVRPPMKGAADDAFFTTKTVYSDGTSHYLPEGFLTRTESLGLVVPTWAQQVEILDHPSVGGFMSHCGWNSTIESICSCVPMIAWPLYAEQRLNATYLVEELGIAVRPRVLPTKEVVAREEIENMLRTLMDEKEGKKMRENVKKLKISAENALRKGGSSYNSMLEMLKHVTTNLKASEHC
ncbi:anthocyanidin 3-O-glucosyltransferase 5-like [Olea europaea var. sylvestris]|uniref:anthocyanidin 3-O-glucosyltransferase 5-like n=1 Tax=Olea europaea var. sylvestris TaxID=158386 RepID=UPI000C1CEB75|nr:anthocyanidin 3-O-glucosyltransferase 5-like [Olea europaea var. sylvestris]